MLKTIRTNKLEHYIQYLSDILQWRLSTYFSKTTALGLEALSPPRINGDPSALDRFILEHQLNQEEVVLVLLSLIPHLQPHLLDQIIREHIPKSGDFPQIGGLRGKNFRGFLPTGETALFLLAGESLDERIRVQQYFSSEHLFARKGLLYLDQAPQGEPRMSAKIILSPELVELFSTGAVSPPAFSMHFPAQRITTSMDWEDLILKEETLRQIRELETWIKHGDTLLRDWGMHKKLKPGYRVLFHGPPGTGKTLTASLLGKYTQKEVYRIDLSMVVSKYIGETEKNLSNLFKKAENKNWILFFDEADALFGKRTNVKDAHDKYANQEVAYLLQRVEYYDGLVILATNFKSNMDEAFIRRFQSIIPFLSPGPMERLLLWQKNIPSQITLASDVDLMAIANKYEITGAGIMNVIQYCCLEALERGAPVLNASHIQAGLKKEFLKEGRKLRVGS